MVEISQMLIIGGVFLTVSLLFAAILHLIEAKKAFNRRVKGLFVIEEEKEKVSGREKLMNIVSIVAEKIPTSLSAKYDSLLYDAGLTTPTSSQYLMIKLLVCFFLAIVLMPFLGWIALLVSFLSFKLADYHLKYLRKRRLQRVVPQLASALGTLSNSMRSGFSFMQAMQLAAEELPDPLGTEFTKTLKQIEHGMTVEEAFHQLMNRVPNRELNIVLTALLIQRSTGGSLASLLDTMRETIEGRMKVKEEVKALTAQGKASAWIIGALPAGLLLLLSLINPEFFAPLYKEPLGWVLLGMAAFLEAVGIFIIRKMINIDVYS